MAQIHISKDPPRQRSLASACNSELLSKAKIPWSGKTPFGLIIGIIIEEVNMKRRKPTHPGWVLFEDVIKPLGITITEAARNLGISRRMFSEIGNGKSRVNPEIAVRIAKATNTSPESWLAMQNKLDLWNAMQNEPKDVVKFEESIVVNQ